MNALKAHSATQGEFWNSYWQAGGNAAYSASGPLQTLLDSFWNNISRTVTAAHPATILDIAAGAGAASRALQKNLQHGPSVQTIACDLSWHAAKHAAKNHFHGVVADARQLPLSSNSIGITVSQFGLEYAGMDALREAARVTRPQGHVALLMHHQAGALHAENERNLGAAEAFLRSRVLPAFAELMRSVGRSIFAEAENRFAHAVRDCSEALHQWGREAAGGNLLQIYRDLAQMHSRIALQNPEEVFRWCEGNEYELQAYVGRMRLMLDVSLSPAGASDFLTALRALGFEARLDELRPSPGALPVAWTLAGIKLGNGRHVP